jgi:hypothetical protein
MMNVVERALTNIFEPMAQTERDAHIRFLRTHFESTPTEAGIAPKEGTKHPPVKAARVGGRRGGLPYYIKWITGLDETKTGGYCFEGSFVQPSRVRDLDPGTPLLIGTKSSPKKYCLAKAAGGGALTFTDAEGRDIRVAGAIMISLHTDVKELIDTLKALHLLKS